MVVSWKFQGNLFSQIGNSYWEVDWRKKKIDINGEGSFLYLGIEFKNSRCKSLHKFSWQTRLFSPLHC